MPPLPSNLDHLSKVGLDSTKKGGYKKGGYKKNIESHPN